MHISISAEPIFHIGSFPFTNSMLAAWLVFGILSILAYFATKRMEQVPKGIQNIFEYIIEALFNLTNGIMKDRKLTKKIFPLIATFFIGTKLTEENRFFASLIIILVVVDCFCGERTKSFIFPYLYLL